MRFCTHTHRIIVILHHSEFTIDVTIHFRITSVVILFILNTGYSTHVYHCFYNKKQNKTVFSIGYIFSILINISSHKCFFPPLRPSAFVHMYLFFCPLNILQIFVCHPAYLKSVSDPLDNIFNFFFFTRFLSFLLHASVFLYILSCFSFLCHL